MLDIRKIPYSIKETGWSAAMFFWTLSVIQSEVMKYFPTSTINPQPSPCLAGRLWNSSLILKIYWYWVSGEEYLIMTPLPLPPVISRFLWRSSYYCRLRTLVWLEYLTRSVTDIYKSELIVLRCLQPQSRHIWISRPYRARQTLGWRISAGTRISMMISRYQNLKSWIVGCTLYKLYISSNLP